MSQTRDNSQQNEKKSNLITFDGGTTASKTKKSRT